MYMNRKVFLILEKLVIDPISTIFTLKILKAICCRQERTSYSWRQRILNLGKDKWKETSLESAHTAQEEKLLVLKDCLIQLWSQHNNQCLKAKPEKLKWYTRFKSEGLDSWANKEWLVLCQQLLDCVILVVFFFLFPLWPQIPLWNSETELITLFSTGKCLFKKVLTSINQFRDCTIHKFPPNWAQYGL